MKGHIIGEDEKDIGTKITDNANNVHQIEMHKSNGEIYAHEQDGYADKSAERILEESEHVSQSRRYAKYYVYKERGHETLPWNLHPDRLATARAAVEALSTAKTEQFFDELLEQSLSHYRDDPSVDTGDVSRPIELPDNMSSHENTVMYEQELYLDENDELETVSGIIVSYYVAKGDKRKDRHGDAPDRDPDARVEISPVPIVAADPLRDYLSYNLRCQIRDCYLVMGIEPPETYKVLGPGQDRFTIKYHHIDSYPEYHDKNANIPGYSYDFNPSSPVPMSELAEAALTGDKNEPLYERVRDLLFTRKSD